MKKIKLGMKLKDKITGFEGIAICKTEYLYGCTRYGLQPVVTKDGAMADSVYFDEDQLEIIGTVEEYKKPTTGGPRPAPQRQKDPSR